MHIVRVSAYGVIIAKKLRLKITVWKFRRARRTYEVLAENYALLLKPGVNLPNATKRSHLPHSMLRWIRVHPVLVEALQLAVPRETETSHYLGCEGGRTW